MGMKFITATFYPICIGLLWLKIENPVILYRFAALMIVVQILKTLTKRLRPNRTDEMSFPSGHAAASWFIAAVYDWNPIIIAWASIVSASRITLKYHYHDDVTVGSILGVLFGGFELSRINFINKHF